MDIPAAASDPCPAAWWHTPDVALALRLGLWLWLWLCLQQLFLQLCLSLQGSPLMCIILKAHCYRCLAGLWRKRCE